ncbi:unnamed protein product [Spirodela intermedia]|uniref:Uncharacterized protein n=1 Tax=Spirodela intermedia TaxID=51605 RepID=A0A7I8JGX2_SPIIN|nr:unnamed protein product [Spirodela intermedia]CAA6669409.1 unnamed protein product [Spirodela intermedia]
MNRVASSSSPCGEAPDRGTCSSFATCPFSTQAQKVGFAADSSILKVLDAEIKCAEECDDHDRKDEIPDRFPFEVKDAPGSTTIALSRDYHGETVKVIVSMPNLVTGDGDDDAGRDRQGSSQSCLPLLVTVSKGDGTSLEFGCTAYPDEVCIDSMVVREARLADEELAYEGPDFHDLDENLQKAFHKYLEIRGISPSTTNYLHEYMINKDSREYLVWLRNVKQFIQE